MDNPQIISRIAGHVLHGSSLSSLASLRLLSQSINSIVEPLLFETVEIALQGRVVGNRSGKLLSVLAKKKRLCLLVKRVKIQSLNPSSCQAPNRRTRPLDESLAMISRFRNTTEVFWYIWSHSTLYESYSPHLFSILGSRSSLPVLSSFTLSLLGSGSQAQLVLPPEAARLGGLSVWRIQCPTPTPTLPARHDTDHWETESTSSSASSSLTLVEDACTYATAHSIDSYSHPTLNLEHALFAPILAIIENSPDLRVLQVEFRPPPPPQPGFFLPRTMNSIPRGTGDRHDSIEAQLEAAMLYEQKVEAFLEEIWRRAECIRVKQSRMEQQRVAQAGKKRWMRRLWRRSATPSRSD
ncbi:hypothetical protein D9758_004305 [Tetrapyrgos nigripes]|uniref:Uncharacterized protein n=1 Tax=Tetrapyrgos nigripes TaxID=182062 RepID=A0A8H5GUQ9_9AGAR|nr:hypothetical protein D9758_004305 [Tetrapyrgos nigripes]